MSARAADAKLTVVREALGRLCGLRSDEVTDASLLRAVTIAADHARLQEDDFLSRIADPSSDGGFALQHLLRKVTVGETTFFRHPEDLDWLRNVALPAAVSRRAAGDEKRLRIWSAGCSTGEEAFTLAALALESVPDTEWEVQVLGTDINGEAIANAKRASYGEWSFRGVPPEKRERWFEDAEASRWRPIESLRSRVDFDYLNLRDPIYPAIFTRTTGLDLIVCRNVFIYFFPDNVRVTLERFAACLEDGGFVLTGPSDLFHAGGAIPGLVPAGSDAHRLRLGVHVPVKRAPAPPKPKPKPFAKAKKGAPPMRAEEKRAPAPDAWLAVLPMLSSGRYGDAAHRANELLAKDPLSLETARCLALALSASADPGAKGAWRRVLYLDPADAGAHFGLGMVLKHEGALEDARAHFRAVAGLLRSRNDSDRVPGPDAIPVGWLRAASQSLAGGDWGGRQPPRRAAEGGERDRGRK